MSTNLFVTVTSVVNRMQINESLEGLTDVVNSALTGAHLHVASAMGSGLDLYTQDCKYYLDADAFSGIQAGGVYRLEVPAYFIRSDRPIVLTASENWKVLNGSVLSSALFEVQYEKGQILIDPTLAGKYLRVQCTTGFDYDAVLIPANPTANPPVVEERGPEAIPDWVHEAILSYVGVVMDVTQTTKRNAEAKDVYQRAAEHALVVLAPKLRKRGFCFRPVAAA